MSELTDKFKEINSATQSNSPTFDDIRDYEKEKVQENPNSEAIDTDCNNNSPF